jgi:hypothetical protein
MVIMSGWVKVHRSILNHWLYTEDRVFSRFEAWNDILLTVNYVDKQAMIKGKLYTIKRGESILSFESWAKRWNWDKTKVRRFLKLLESDSMVVIKSDNKTTHLTVCNFERYQDERNADETQTKRKRNSNATQTKPTKEREEREEGKEGESVKPALSDLLVFMSKEEGQRFLNHYNANGWKVGRNKMVDWKQAAEKWANNEFSTDKKKVKVNYYNPNQYE